MSGQISWDYDRAGIITDGVVHAIGVCDQLGDDARALGCLQHVAGLARQVGSAPASTTPRAIY
jgi:hypothetical protein